MAAAGATASRAPRVSVINGDISSDAKLSHPAHAQACSTRGNGGILQSEGTCVVNHPVTPGLRDCRKRIDSANVATNGTVTANGGGTGISATTNAEVTANGNVTAASIGFGRKQRRHDHYKRDHAGEFRWRRRGHDRYNRHDLP
jgi:hypothetical protein